MTCYLRRRRHCNLSVDLNRWCSRCYFGPTNKIMGSGGSIIRRRRVATHIPDKTYVQEITPVELGRFLVKTCGNEGQHPYLDEKGKTTLKFLRASIAFIPEAIAEYGANMRNGSFIYAQPGNEFVITAGNGDWEFKFSQSQNPNEISCDCLRKPMWRYLWDGVVWTCSQFKPSSRRALRDAWQLTFLSQLTGAHFACKLDLDTILVAVFSEFTSSNIFESSSAPSVLNWLLESLLYSSDSSTYKAKQF